MRRIVLDTETTGLETREGHRVIEIGAIEMLDRQLSGRQFHYYLNPDREMDEGAIEVHGITSEFLEDKPRFKDIAEEFLEFITGAELVIHNAPFDVGFLNYELSLLSEPGPEIESLATLLDTLVLARELHPGQRNSLDALCKRYMIDNTRRSLHGALLDAEILAEVYLAMTGGQVDLLLSQEPVLPEGLALNTRVTHEAVNIAIVEPSEAEWEAHRARLMAIEESSNGQCLWRSDLPRGDQ